MSSGSMPREGRWVTRSAAVAIAVAGCLVVFACSDDAPLTLGYGVNDDAGGALLPPADAARIEEPRTFCPSNKCPEGYTTCPNSKFPCDVNLKTNRENCGACGSACPASTYNETFECAEGRCTLHCDPTGTMDCDGLVDNGCETPMDDEDNCGACGNKCSPDKPCMNWGTGWKCGCPPGETLCLEPFHLCVKAKEDEHNCGRCNNQCDRDSDGDGGTPPPNSYFGCVDGQCGGFKCEPDTANCDGNRANGCEVSLRTRENCGACGNVCPANQECLWSGDGYYQCLCPPGLTYCSGDCVDVGSDRRNCGSCGIQCHDDHLGASFGVCTYGMCNRQCASGRADCNGNPEDDCEVNTNSDPRNCGGCGIVCDAIAGQACVVGKCVFEPCPLPDGGPVAR